MPERISTDNLRRMLAKFKDVIHLETGFPVLIYDGDGRVIMATDKTCIGDVHEVARNIMLQPADACGPVAAGRTCGDGYYCPVFTGDRPVAAFGIPGDPAVVRPVARMALKLIQAWISEFQHHEELERRVGERTVILRHEIEGRKQVEQTLRKNRARFEAFVRATPDILFVFDQDGTYVEIFTSSEELLMDDIGDLKGRRIRDVLPEKIARRHERIIRDTLESDRGRHFEYEMTVRKGTCWFESRTAPIRGVREKKRLVAASVRDITNRKLAEKEISEKEKLSVVIETAGAVCHEFNQPLQIMLGYCELLKEDPELSAESLKIVETIAKEVARMGNMNKNLMNITSYKTKSYLASRIIDLDKSTGS